MQCLILAGGLGTRLQAAVPNLPKCLAPVQGQPFLYWMIQMLHSKGVRQFTLSLGYQSKKIIQVIEHFPSAWKINYIVESEPLGTGGAAKYAIAGMVGEDDVLICNGDTWLDVNLDLMLRPLSNDDDEDLRMGVIFVQDRSRYGGIFTEGMRLTGFEEKVGEGPGWINAGIYMVNRKIFLKDDLNREFSFEKILLPRLVKSQKVKIVHLRGIFVDIGIPEDYHRFCKFNLPTNPP